jgi:hypothetical protein
MEMLKMTDWNGNDRRGVDPMVKELASKLQMLHGDVSEIKSALKELTLAINKLAIIEERQSAISMSVERAFVAIEKIEIRITSIEKDAPNNHRVGAWVDRAVFAVIGLAVMFVIENFRGR